VSERYTQEMHQEYRRKADARAAKLEQERQERTAKESARRAWVADGGQVGDFERQWVQIRDEARRRRVADADRRAREEMQQRGVSRI
jgi:hypothetical protein